MQKKTDLLSNRELRNFFINALDYNDRKNLLKENIEGMEESVDFLLKMEMLSVELNLRNKNEIFAYKPSVSFSKNKKTNVWCRFHKTNSHSNDECYSQKKETKNIMKKTKIL